VKGTVQGLFESECDRCLDRAVLPLRQEFRLLYQPIALAPTTTELEIEEKGEEVGYYERDGVALEDVLREVILLELPMHALCQPDCQGVCAQCGTNWNLADCTCAEAKLDDRWEALKGLSLKAKP
jgi:uncharacterized protein